MDKEKFLHATTQYGAYTVLLLSLELLFIWPLHLAHLLILLAVGLRQKRFLRVALIILLSWMLSAYIDLKSHYKPSLPLDQVVRTQVYLSQDATPNALMRTFVSGYTLWLESSNIRTYQEIPVQISISNLDRVLRRGSVIEIDIAGQQQEDRYWLIFSNTKAITPSNLDDILYLYPLWQLRAKWLATIQSFLQSRQAESAGLYLAVSLGDRQLLSPHLKRLFQSTGLAHLLALSGLHASTLIALLYFITKALRPKPQILLILPFILLHLWLAGLPYTLLRAYLMALAALLLNIHYRRYYALDILALSSIIILLLDVRALYALGYHLSFLSVWGIIVFYRPIRRVLLALLWLPKKWLKLRIFLVASMATSFAVDLVISPLILSVFGEIQLTSFLSNILFPPIFIFFMILASLTLVIPSLRYLLNGYHMWMQDILGYLDIALVQLEWQPILIGHLVLALSLVIWHNGRDDRTTKL
jgi:ComEC/Rec2-related protein